jgi:hypothetical protein
VQDRCPHSHENFDASAVFSGVAIVAAGAGAGAGGGGALLASSTGSGTPFVGLSTDIVISL